MSEMVEDSGIDCEAYPGIEKPPPENLTTLDTHQPNGEAVKNDTFIENKSRNHNANKIEFKEGRNTTKLSELPNKLEKLKSVAFKRNPKVLPRNRLKVPGRGDTDADNQPLVLVDIDSSEDEEELNLGRHAQPTSKLLKQPSTSNNLETSLEDDLDLIPPRPLHERCVCCNIHFNCVIS